MTIVRSHTSPPTCSPFAYFLILIPVHSAFAFFPNHKLAPILLELSPFFPIRVRVELLISVRPDS